MSSGYDLASLGIEVRADGVLVATKALKDLTKTAKDAENQTKKTGSAATSAASSFKSMGSSLSLISNLLKLEMLRRAADVIYDLGKNVYKTNLEMQSINNTFKAATGSASLGAQEMQFLRDESKRLGLDLLTAADAHRTLTAAARGTTMEGQQARNIFLAVAEASTVLGLSSQKTEMAMYALQQMISKGVVSMEELRRQLGDQIPGAFQIAARSMGLSEKDFNKLVESGQLFTQDFMPGFVKAMREQFAGGVEDASQSARAELNRFNNAVLELKQDIGEGGFFNAMTEALREFARVLADPAMKENMRALGEFAGTVVSGIAGVAKIANLRGQAETLQQLQGLKDSGTISKEEYDAQFRKHTGWTGGVNQSDRGVMEGLEAKLEVQRFVDNVMAEQINKQKELNRLANPAQLSRELEQVSTETLARGKREEDQQRRIGEARDKGFSEWTKSIANIDDKQRAINKLNDDYNAKVVAGISAIQKYGFSAEQAKTLSIGGSIDGLDVMSPEQRRVAEQAREQFALAKQYRDKEEQDIIDKENRTAQKGLDQANKRQKKINDISQDLAKLTMSDLDRELLNIDIKFEEVAAEIGDIPPELTKWRDLQRELVQQNFADEMRDAMNGYLIQLKEAELGASGVGAANLEVMSLEAEKVKELTNLRKEYYRVGADNSFYESLTKLVEKQYELRIGVAKYAEAWEEANKKLAHTAELAEILGIGTHKATMEMLKSQQQQIANDPFLDAVEKQRQLQLNGARMFREELDELREQQAIWEDALGQIMENTYNVGNIEAYFNVHEDLLNGQMQMLGIELQLAETEAERANIMAQMEAISQKIKENTAAKDMDVGTLAEIGLQRFRSDSHMEMVDFYKDLLPNAIKTTSNAMGEFVADMVTGEAQISDAWDVIKGSIHSAALSIVQDLTRLFMQKALIEVIGLLTGTSFSGGMSSYGSSPAAGYGASGTDIFGGAAQMGVSLLSLVASAKGNVFENNMAGISKYSSSIIKEPTLFPFAKGAGLMGEAGWEAVMPLARTSNGELGVTTVGKSGSSEKDETTQLLREVVSALRSQKGTKVVNAIGKGAIANELNGAEGEQVIFNHIRRNPAAIRRMLGI